MNRGTVWLTCCLALVGPSVPRSLESQAISPLPLRESEITFRTRVASAPDFTGRAPAASAEFRGTDLANVTGTLEIRVAEMRTGIGARDSHLRGTLKADSFPTIRFELVGVDPQAARGDTVPLTFQGHLTIRGVTKTVRIPGELVLRTGRVEVHASTPLDMREYGVDPPVRLLARVQPVVELAIRMVFGG